MFIKINNVYYNINHITKISTFEYEDGDIVCYNIEYKALSGGTLIEKFETEEARTNKINSIIGGN